MKAKSVPVDQSISFKADLAALFQDILSGVNSTPTTPGIELSADPAHGEYTTNVALKIATFTKFSSPNDLALWVKEKLDAQLSGSRHKSLDHNIQKKHQKIPASSGYIHVLSAIDHVEVAGPGFINVFLTEANLINQVSEVLKQGQAYG